MGKRIGLAVMLAGLLSTSVLATVAPVAAQYTFWLGRDWAHRREVDIANPCGGEVTDYQVQISLDSTNFDFDLAESDGVDLRVTSSNGGTLIPFWIESWDAVGETASVWVKVPVIPVEGTSVFLYYGSGPVMVETAPTGPWTKHASNPIVPTGGPSGGDGLLAENMVYDSVTGHYVLSFANYGGTSAVNTATSPTPDDPSTWTWQGSAVGNANSPHLIQHGDTWYMFYADRAHTADDMPGYTGPYTTSWPISVATRDAALGAAGVYTYDSIVLASTEPWEAFRVDEPYVFWCGQLFKWVLIYMGDEGSTTEQIGYATSDFITGPYTKHTGNPVIAFGPPGSIDAGTVADPWVIEMDGVSYIGYTVSPTKSHPWRTSYVTTDDWGTFTKSNEIILDLGPAGAWDEDNAFRGAVSRFGDTYYFPYTGATALPYVYRMGLATQPVMQEEFASDADEVFLFHDSFDADVLDGGKWTVLATGSGGSTVVASGTLTLTGESGLTSGYIEVFGSTSVVTGTLLEARVQHPDAGLNAGPTETNTAFELGYKGGSWDDVIRIMDYPDMISYTVQATAGTVTSGYTETALAFDTDWHAYRVYRTLAGTIQYYVDGAAVKTLGPDDYVHPGGLSPWLMSYGRYENGLETDSRVVVDEILVRNYCGADSVATVGTRMDQPTEVTVTSFKAEARPRLVARLWRLMDWWQNTWVTLTRGLR